MISLEDVRRAIDADEPNYDMAALKLGTAALPHLEYLAAQPDVMTSSKAVSLAGVIGGPQAASIIRRAANATAAEVRVVAAVAASRLGAAGEDVVAALLSDPDTGVRKYALRAIGDAPSAKIREVLETIRTTEASEPLRRQIAQLLR